MKKLSYSLLIGITLAFNVWAFGELSFKTEISIDKEKAKKVFIDVGAGTLDVRGGDVDEVIVHAKVYSTKYNSLDDLQHAFNDRMEFDLQHKGSTIVFKALNKKKLLSFSNPDIAIDVEVTLPRHMNVSIDDGSGNMKVSDIDGSLEIDDGSGSTFVQNIGGKVNFDDGSGHVEINGVEGDVHIDDGSGNLKLTNINGSVFVDDSSGGLEIHAVTGNVSIDDGSGSINVMELAGDFKLIDDGSGSVTVNGKKWIKD